MMTSIPNEIIERDDLTLLERAIFPIVVRYSFGWGVMLDGATLPDIKKILQDVDPRSINEALDMLVYKGMVEIQKKKHGRNMLIYHRVSESLVSHVSAATPSAQPNIETIVNTPALSNRFLDMQNNRFVTLHQNAIDFMVKSGYEGIDGIWTDYVDECRSYNLKATDWDAHFRTWLRKKGNSPALHNSKYVALPEDKKPNQEQFRAAEYLYHKHLQINKAFTVPDNMQYEGYQIKLIMDTTQYTLDDVVRCIEWLFTKDGDWYRPNITSCSKLREKMDYIYGHTVSYADAHQLLPDGVNVLDLLASMKH
jgi:hypothetical protein